MTTSEMTLFDSQGRRKYLCRAELERFLAAAGNLPPRERAFCQTLVYSGGRLAEVLALRKMDIDRKQGAIVIKSLKKRDKTHHRSVPVAARADRDLRACFRPRAGQGKPSSLAGHRPPSEPLGHAGHGRGGTRTVFAALTAAYLWRHGSHKRRPAYRDQEMAWTRRSENNRDIRERHGRRGARTGGKDVEMTKPDIVAYHKAGACRRRAEAHPRDLPR